MIVRADAGYSLLELLIALALLAFIGLAMMSGARFGARAWEKSSATVDALERTQGAQTVLRTLLQRLHPRDFDPAASSDPDLVRGTRQAFAFAAVAPSAFDAAGLTRFRLAVEGAPGGQRLVLAWRAAAAGRARTHTLIAGARAISFGFAKRDDTGRLVWTDEWSGQSGAPDLVMVRAAFAPASGLRWPDLFIRTRIMRDPACVYNPDTFTCRHG